MEEIRVYPRHLREAGMCGYGAKMFCERYGIDWKEFIKNGIPVSQVKATGDELGMQVVRVAENGR